MPQIKSQLSAQTAFAPATCANVAVGFDILGFALENLGDRVTLSLREDDKIVIEAIRGQENLPRETTKNTASWVVQKLCQDLKLKQGFSLEIEKGIPLSSGLGGSAASAVAALIAMNAFLEKPLSREALLPYALLGEALASGQGHADNVVPCLFGGLTLILSTQPLEIVELPSPELFCVLAHPHLQVTTQEARKILQQSLSLQTHTQQAARLAAFIAALYRKDFDLMQKALEDLVIEPQRAHFVPGFKQHKEAALRAGALGASFSGSGPSIFALAKTQTEAEKISSALRESLKNEKIEADFWISKIAKTGARIEDALHQHP